MATRRRHLEVIIVDAQERRVFAACSLISVTNFTGLTPHVQLVTCRACRAQIRRAMALR